MHKLICAVQKYDWGKPGSQSTVAALVRDGRHSDYVDDDKPYAELWMGVHPNGPSKIVDSTEDLSTLIKDHPNFVAKHEQGMCTLQFLFKVLSVKKALSVQSHPTKEEAVVLHAKDPLHYPDPNHKPEMAIALTDFELLCSFRPAKEIYENLSGAPEVLKLIGDSDDIENLRSSDESLSTRTLKNIFTVIWSSSPVVVARAVHELVGRIKTGDVGVFAPLLLNYFSLRPGEATFLGPNEPHAYLSGDCIECMSCSDNTIRAGLTPKFKDIQTLCANLTYTMKGPPIFPHRELLPGVLLYSPPVQEFAVQAVKVPATRFTEESTSSIVVVITGSAHFHARGISLDVRRGDVVFFTATAEEVHIDNPSSDFLCYRAFTPKR
uniref:mannose-6-phosphate isomerase n=1 Tax=Angiostrongylus cantonensis TaxID=6313 RepID=A0A0K0D6B3_ANGCA